MRMMIPLLANLEVSPTQLGVFMGCLIAFLGLWSQLGKAKDRLVSEAVAALRAQLGLEASNKLPSPLLTHHVEVPMERESFHKHAEINRSEHSRIELKFDGAVKSIESDVSEIAVQVAQIKVMREANGQALHGLTTRVEELSDNVNELSGAVHQLLRPSPKQRRNRRTA